MRAGLYTNTPFWMSLTKIRKLLQITSIRDNTCKIYSPLIQMLTHLDKNKPSVQMDDSIDIVLLYINPNLHEL